MTVETKVTVILRDADGVRRADMSDWDATTMLACVSSDPRSMHELELAWRRYRDADSLREFSWGDWCDSPLCTNWVLIDLAALQVVSLVEEWATASHSVWEADDPTWDEGVTLVWVNPPPAWKFIQSDEIALRLLESPRQHEPIDFRGVLYGRGLAEGLAALIFQVAETESIPVEYVDPERAREMSQDDRVEAMRWYRLAMAVHAEWLLTPRTDLGGEPPRTFLHRGRSWADREIKDRMQQWSHFGQPPRPLDRETFAYRHGPMSTDEVCVYFDFCRAVINLGWQLWLRGIEQADLAMKLREYMSHWLEVGSGHDEDGIPSEVIETSRMRMPQLASSFQFDCDCPICRMMAENDSNCVPAFSLTDGHHLELDDHFAFSLWEHREEWEMEQRAWWDGESDDDETKKDNGAIANGAIANGAIAEWNGDDPVPACSPLGLAFRFAELVSDLQQVRAPQAVIDGLNQGFDALRHAEVGQADVAVAELIIRLESLLEFDDSLTSKVANLQSLLHEWKREVTAPR